MDIYWGAVPFVAIQVLMVAAIIAFPGIVTSNVSHAPGAIKGSGADELRRQIEGSPPPAVPARSESAKGKEKEKEAPKAEDAGSELERLLREQK